MKTIFSLIRDNHEQIFRAFLFLFSLVLIINFFPKQGKFKYEFVKGKPWMHETLIAPFDFPILKSVDELRQERIIVEESHIPIFNYNSEVYTQKATDFILDFEKKWSENRKIKRDDKFTFFNLSKQRKIDNKTRKFTLANFGLDRLKIIYQKGVIQLTDEFSWRDDDFKLLVLRDGLAEKSTINDFYTLNDAANYLNIISDLSDEEYNFLVPLLISSLDHNIIYNEVESSKLLESNLNDIMEHKDLIQKGQIIISKGELINDINYQELYSCKKEYENKSWSQSSFAIVAIGQFLLVFIALLILFMFIRQFRYELLNSTTKITLILSQIVMMVAIASYVIKWDVQFIYLVPFCILPIILKAFFDTRIALFSHLITVLIIGFIVPNSFEFVFLQLIAGIVSILTVLKMYKRSQLFMSVAKIIAVYLLMYISLSMMQEGSFQSINLMNFLYFAGSGALTLFSYPLIFAFEKVFSLVSDISLLELSDTNSPLLRMLSEDAPGTFQHSLQVANLAEQGIIEIGGNALLTRAGAIYHDIGKLKNPMYFIENQGSNLNPHDDLSFEESASVIINHVIHGIELAKQYNLPDELIDFIRTHHGTTTVQYFYKQFLTSYPNQEIDVDDFTYPGPVPFSKETAVLMMADSVEAATRSIKQPNPESIDEMVEQVINKQIDDNQFINADITLKEINTIKKLFKKKLCDIYHSRVEY